MNRRLVVAVAALALLVGVVGFTDVTAQEDDQDLQPLVQNGEEFDTTVFRIAVFPNGDARWTLEQHRQIPLNDKDAIDNFGAFAAEFTTNETTAFENFQIRASRLTEQGTDATSREMNASEFSRDAYYQDRLQRGVVEMSFRWHGFAPVDGNEVTVSDVLAGFALLEDQRLEIRAGGNLTFQGVQPDPDDEELGSEVENESVSWRGPQSFDQEALEVALVPESSVSDPNDNGTMGGGTTDGNETDGQTTDGSDDGGNGDSDMLMPVLIAFLLMIGVGGGAVWYTLSRAESETSTPATTDVPESPTADSENGAAVPEGELLSDEDLVIQLLEENGGRMRQVSIVEETEWSKSKVSMLLSDMEDDDEISKLRVGRENIISLVGEEPEAAGSPFEGDDDR